MKIKIGNSRKIFYLKYERKNGETQFLWKIENDEKRWLWWYYSNSKRDERINEKQPVKGQYHFCLMIPKIITLDTAYIGKKFIGRVNLTRLFKKDYHVYSSSEDCVYQSNN